MTKEERMKKTEEIIKILEFYGIIYPQDRQDTLPVCPTASQTVRPTEH